jgi:hypothetical protein
MNSRQNSKIKHDTEAASASGLSELKARQSSKIGKIRQALVAAGFDTLTKQAAVLGLSKSTTWAVLRGNHKGSGLSTSVINRILRSQELPRTVRRIIEEYVQEKLLGEYGHDDRRLRKFSAQLGHWAHLLSARKQ